MGRGPIAMRIHEGMVQSYLHKETKELVDDRIRMGHHWARFYAPRRTGALKANIQWAGAKPYGPYQNSGYFYANIRYARYVNDGTTGPIYPKTAKQLRFRAEGRDGAYGKGRWVRRDWVAGQDGQHFMERGLKTAMASTYT